MLFVAAVPDASNIWISSPTEGEAGRVRVLAALVSTKYLTPADKVIFDDID
jgi:hypothetical protein